MSWAPSPTKTKTNKYTREEKYKSRGQAGGDEYKDLGINRWNRWRRGGVGFSRSTRFLGIVCRERVLCLLVTWEVEVEVQAWVHVEVAIGQAGPGQQWAGPKYGRAKIGPIFSGQNFNSPARPKNRAGRDK